MSPVYNFVTRRAFGHYIRCNRTRLLHLIYTYSEKIGISITEFAKIKQDIWHEYSVEVFDKFATFLYVERQLNAIRALIRTVQSS